MVQHNYSNRRLKNARESFTIVCTEESDKRVEQRLQVSKGMAMLKDLVGILLVMVKCDPKFNKIRILQTAQLDMESLLGGNRGSSSQSSSQSNSQSNSQSSLQSGQRVNPPTEEPALPPLSRCLVDLLFGNRHATNEEDVFFEKYLAMIDTKDFQMSMYKVFGLTIERADGEEAIYEENNEVFSNQQDAFDVMGRLALLKQSDPIGYEAYFNIGTSHKDAKKISIPILSYYLYECVLLNRVKEPETFFNAQNWFKYCCRPIVDMCRVTEHQQRSGFEFRYMPLWLDYLMALYIRMFVTFLRWNNDANEDEKIIANGTSQDEMDSFVIDDYWTWYLEYNDHKYTPIIQLLYSTDQETSNTITQWFDNMEPESDQHDAFFTNFLIWCIKHIDLQSNRPEPVALYGVEQSYTRHIIHLLHGLGENGIQNPLSTISSLNPSGITKTILNSLWSSVIFSKQGLGFINKYHLSVTSIDAYTNSSSMNLQIFSKF